MISRELLCRPNWPSESTQRGWCSILFQDWPHVKSQSDTNHQTTNCVSQPLLQPCCRIHPYNRQHPKTASSVVAKHVFNNHRRGGPTWRTPRNRREKQKEEREREKERERTPTTSVCPSGSKNGKTASSESTRAEFTLENRADILSHRVTSTLVLAERKVHRLNAEIMRWCFSS